MPLKGWRPTEEQRARMSTSHVGKPGRPHTEESKRRISEAKLGTVCTEETQAKLRTARVGKRPALGMTHSEESRAKMSDARRGQPLSEDHKKHIGEAVSKVARRNWSGGVNGDLYADFLCPLGYRREFCVQWGKRPGEKHLLDFALVEAKVNIELDGKWHKSTTEQDAVRDSRLKALGWKIIRIRT